MLKNTIALGRTRPNGSKRTKNTHPFSMHAKTSKETTDTNQYLQVILLYLLDYTPPFLIFFFLFPYFLFFFLLFSNARVFQEWSKLLRVRERERIEREISKIEQTKGYQLILRSHFINEPSNFFNFPLFSFIFLLINS